jgi:molecular chaperone DnaK
MSKSIGIDLGTTNSVAAIKRLHTEVIRNTEGELITPSCVTAEKKTLSLFKPKIVVGRHALEWMKQDPENTIMAVKRLMGRSFKDKEVQQIINDRRFRYGIRQHSRGTENSLAIILAGKEYTPEEISAEILNKIRKDVEKVLGGEVEYAVITVPAYFNDKQKHATRTAAALCGLKVRRLLPEPTAAAISFGVDHVRGEETRTVLVFDFGGGTFDLSVLTISGGQFIEQGKGGDMWLGGEDLDRLISDFVLMETARENRIDDIRALIEQQGLKEKNRFLAELNEKVEKAKIRLSTETEAQIEILSGLKDQDGDHIDLDVELTRERFDRIIAPVVDSTVRLTKKILDDIHFTADMIDQVLLVGGSSLIPGVIGAMKREFGDEKVLVHERPMLAIAEGAAILSHRLADTYECPGCGVTVAQADSSCSGCGFDLEKYTIEEGVLDLVHSAAQDYYLYLENNVGHLLVQKNTPLPFEIKEKFTLVDPEQRLVHLKFFNTVNEKEESIGDLWLGIDDRSAPPSDEDDDEQQVNEGPLHVEITLKIDESNIVEVRASLEEYPDLRLSKTLSRGSADERLFLSLERMIIEANQKQYTIYQRLDLTARALSVIKDINRVVNPETGRVDEHLYDFTARKIEKSEKMAANDRSGKAMIYYAKSVLISFGSVISPKNQEDLLQKIKGLEKADETGTYEENIEAINGLGDSLDKLGSINMVMQIKKAGDVCLKTDPARAPKFYRAIDDIMQALLTGDQDQAGKLVDEIMPESLKILKALETTTGIIHKDIKR